MFIEIHPFKKKDETNKPSTAEHTEESGQHLENSATHAENKLLIEEAKDSITVLG